ncbi:CCR4-Not complex component, Not1-domain-containing protein [Cokeromyces recurvatus]|uniref:CCR4-Not complex component, Not1-domain-containing protein n=1 Tax=Cokeromyces recurvatus TaxID=90255 RepID=UPI00221E6C59|nr:CCR4-Not complex component, Not1-domain-containing protein [Cokeromyces recurvatus]KAI7901129.1 CCR4-Not complex component, Not1-domain-containing protein [Cokeromyces recurvatus]
MVYCSTDLLDLNQTATKKVIPEDVIPTLPISLRQAANQLASQQLNCFGLLEAIMDLAGTAASEDVKVLMDRLAIQAPELLMIGLAQIQPTKNELHRLLLPKLLNIFLIGHVNSPLVIRLLWHVQLNFLLEGFFEMYKKDPTSISRILDICQEAKIVVHILKTNIPFFTLDLASLAARRQNLNLEKWLLERLAKDGFTFFGACIDFLEKKCAIEMARQSGANVIPTLQLSMDVIRIFFRILSERSLPTIETAKLTKLSQLYTQLYPQLNENRFQADKKITGMTETATSNNTINTTTNPINENERNYSEEVEEMVRLYFERLYTKDISPSRFASVLKACRTSNDQRQVNFFSCTTHTLLDEARFFNQYPENELMATGELLGLLIDQHLISFSQLRITLKLILDALKHPVGSKMFNFGIQALIQFRGRLFEWPQYTLLLSKIEGLRGYPTIVESIAITLKQLAQKDPEGKMMVLTSSSSSSASSPKTSSSTLSSVTPSGDSGNTAERSADTAPNVTTLLQSSSKQTYDNPPDKIQERVSFLINNLSATNMKSKATELRELLQKSTWGWFSHYLVVRRVSIEPNNHELYSALLDELDIQPLVDTVIEETYANIHLLLQSDSIVKSSADRNLLKNMGTWLGRLTIAKNKPIRHKDLSFKDLLVSAYGKNQLVVAIPLVCKVLQHASNSKIFKPPNPWLMGCLKLLAELYWTEGLKLNLKFEIELLYKALNLDLNEIEPTSLLNKGGPPGIANVSNKPSSIVDNSPTASQKSVPVSNKAILDGQIHPPPMNNTPNLPSAQNARQEIDIIPILAKLQINPAIAQLMIQQPIIKSTVYAGISEAFYEVVPPIIATSANIASISTKEMVLKDFATEPDETRLQRAAHAMVQPLACSLSVVTCKEPLYNGIVTVISNNLTQNGLPKQLSEEIASTIANENIELLCVYVDQLTKIKALEDIDRGLAPAYASRITFRKQHQYQNTGERFFDVLSLNGAPHSVHLPNILRPANGVSPEQVRLYESLDQRSYLAMQQQQQQQQLSPAVFHPEVMSHPIVPPQPFVGGESPNPLLANSAPMLNAKLEQMLLELDRLIRHSGITAISQLPPNHDICLLIRQTPLLISQSPSPLQTMITFVEKVVLMLYQSNTAFALEVYTMFLQSLFEISSEVTKETLSWLIYADDERKYNVSAVAMLIRYELLPLEEYDVQLAKLINAKADSVIEYATSLISTCLLSQTPITFLEDHILTVSSLYKLVKNDEAPANVVALMNDLRKLVEEPYKDVIKQNIDCLELRMLLAEWIRLFQHPMATDTIFTTLVERVLEINKTEEQRCFFFRICTETCVNHYLAYRSVSTIHHRRMIHLIDSFTKLIIAMVTTEEENSDIKSKVKLLNNALSVIILVLSHHHESKGVDFNQKPFLRLFASIFNEISKIHTKPLDTSTLITFSDTLYTLQPSNFPGFAFSWLQLISSRSFLPQLLVANDNNGALLCQKLIHALLRFLGPLLEEPKLSHATKMFYRGTLRVLVVLLHDFPEFLCRNYILFAQAIPHSCVQIRNLILSAFPRVMHLPDPFTLDLKLSVLPESSEDPVYDESYVSILNENDFKSKIDDFVKNKNSTTFFSVLEKQIGFNTDHQQQQETTVEDIERHNINLLCAFVLYIGVKSLKLKEVELEESPAIIAYNYLLSKLEPKGRYTLLSAIADHLRYPNSHTCFFSSTLLLLFSKHSEDIKEQITRVLLERLIVNRPHPWGLLASFIELIKVPKFWDHEFIRCSPDIERLFDNVSR